MELRLMYSSRLWSYSTETDLYRLQKQIITISFLNFFIVAILGVALRSSSFFDTLSLDYKNLLHGHSHFAFGGWLLPLFIAFVIRFFPHVASSFSINHWKKIVSILFISAYGMLIFFSMQGYSLVSIVFSTASTVTLIYISVLVIKSLKLNSLSTSHKFLKWAFIYASLSAIGPFATAPIMALGLKGSHLYFDAIYFYLHFQYNGFFTFMVLATMYRLLEKKGIRHRGKITSILFNSACAPAYFLSVLWHKPDVIFNFIGGIGAVLQFIAVFFLLKDFYYDRVARYQLLFKLSFAALILKSILQLVSAFPAVAQFAVQQRDILIAYLHLVLIGCITLFTLSVIVKNRRRIRVPVALFLFSFLSTEVLLILNALGGFLNMQLPRYTEILLISSILSAVSIGWIALVRKSNAEVKEHPNQLLRRVGKPVVLEEATV